MAGGGKGGDIIGGISNLGQSYIQGEAQKSTAETAKRAQTDVANINAKTAAEQLAWAKQVYGEQSDAYKQALQNAQNKAAEVGTNLEGLYSNTSQNLQRGYLGAIEQAGQIPQEMQTLKSDIESGNLKTLAQGRNQMAANLAMSGIRGGQAATLMNRGTGEQAEAATENINKLMAEAANQSKAYKQALMQQGLTAQQSLGQQRLSGAEAYKQALQNFLYNPESAKYAK